MFNRYKKLQNQINNLKDSNKHLNNELHELMDTVNDHYKFKVLYKPRLDWAFMFNPEVIEKYFFDKETAIEFVKDNLSNKDEPIILDLKTGKTVDFIQLKEKK
ncbi:Hypothetical protein NCDO2118_1666 [Lactococcus lactis subsp. lactis NCDO 2118]|uniref:Uncharacterized protein n=1 Tax=Lactococcus lactis subsp. lactis NCDO 2118 TaxID=1117941 RepID=A0ABC8A6X6_LACLL|nr:hypothetical protein [Lactococcus lactis]AII13130.1 Hypothetical protein NCDO2118_1666 [Lactococcus lactis subsp. lactis NCDO 2118]